jgi:hypothetical protein
MYRLETSCMQQSRCIASSNFTESLPDEIMLAEAFVSITLTLTEAHTITIAFVSLTSTLFSCLLLLLQQMAQRVQCAVLRVTY